MQNNTTDPEQNNRDQQSERQRLLIALLFLLLSFACIFCSSYGAIWLVDRDQIAGAIRARGQADYGPGALLALAPIDESILQQIARDESDLQTTPSAPSINAAVVALLPQLTPVQIEAPATAVAQAPTATPVPRASPTPPLTTAPPTSTPEPATATATSPAPTSTSAPSTSTPAPATPTASLPTPTASPTVALPTSTSTPVPPTPTTVPPTATPSPTPTTAPPTSTPTLVPTVPTNTPPTSTDDVASVPEGSSVIIDVLFNDNDTDGTIVVGSLLITVGPINGTAVANTSTGTITYTPNQNYSGTDTLQYQICDDGGDCSTASVSITITPVNDPPVAVDDNLTLAEDSPSTLNVLANDTDVDSPSLSISAVGNPANGSVVNNTSSLFYTPAQDFFGSDVFTYTITDGTLSDTATVSLTVTPVNDAPVANPDSASTAEDTREVINVRQNDVDVENDRLTIIAVTSPSNGTATTNGNIVIYTPNLNFDGTDIFTYTLSDGLLTDTTTVSVTIIPINDPPQANPDTYTTPANTPLTVAAPGVLANDTDVDSSALRVALISGPSSGTLVLNADGSFVFTPAPGFTGTVTFDYRVFDSRDDSNTVTVTIIVG